MLGLILLVSLFLAFSEGLLLPLARLLDSVLSLGWLGWLGFGLLAWLLAGQRR